MCVCVCVCVCVCANTPCSPDAGGTAPPRTDSSVSAAEQAGWPQQYSAPNHCGSDPVAVSRTLSQPHILVPHFASHHLSVPGLFSQLQNLLDRPSAEEQKVKHY